MRYNKIFTILFILCIFATFTTFEICRKSDKAVLNIITPNTVEIDLNGNNVYDSGETICIPNVKTFTSNLTINQTNLAKNLNLTNEDAIKLGYITDNFADSILSDKRVKLKFTKAENQDCKFADIIIENQSYRNKLLNSGLGFTGNKPYNQTNYQKQLAKAKKYKLVILNHKSNKYHTLNCKYGLIAHDAIVIPAKQIPDNAKPCKFCHIIQDKKYKKYNNNKNNYKTFIQPYPQAISNGSLKMYLSDLTIKLKPDNKCSSLACQEILTQINNSKNTIDIALYGWDKTPEIKEALIRAKTRGVKIRLVYDTSEKVYYKDIQEIISLADESSTDTPKILMHNKFIIFDNQKVITGSMNFSNTGFSGFNTNCIIFVNSQDVAKIYEEEFNIN